MTAHAAAQAAVRPRWHLAWLFAAPHRLAFAAAAALLAATPRADGRPG